MPLFNFFRRNMQSTGKTFNPAVMVPAMNAVNSVDKELFIDTETPEANEVNQTVYNPLENFLAQKFDQKGYNDGYLYPDGDFLDQQIKLIRAEFRKAIDQCFDTKRKEVCELRLHKLKVGGISPKMESQMDEKIKSLEVILNELELQKNLSVADEGLVSTALHGYRIGFIKGLDRYQQEKIFAGSTGLFTK